MKQLIVATLLLFTTLAGVAFNGAPTRDTRPTLLVIKQRTPPCAPCVAWKQAYDNPADSRLRNAIVQNFRLHAFYGEDRPDLVAHHHVDRFPTFIVLDSRCRETDRVHGFMGPEQLFRELRDGHNPYSQSRDMRTPTTPDLRLHPGDSGPSGVFQEINDTNQQLQAERGFLQQSLKAAEEDLSRERQQAAAKAKQLREQLDQLRHQLQTQRQSAAQQNATTPQKERPPDRSRNGWETGRGKPSMGEEPKSDWLREELEASTSSKPSPIDISAEMSDTPGTLAKWASWGSWLAGVGARLAAPEISVPLTAATTIVGFGVRWWSRRKKNRPKTIDGRDGRGTQTEFVTKVVDYEAEQIRVAIRRVGRRYSTKPELLAVIREVESVSQQLIHGQRVIREDEH